MTPKEKANELFDKFNKSDILFYQLDKQGAKLASIIAVDEIINSRPVITDNQVDYNNYWISVMDELNAL